jgi:uncharacterized protein with FMN-binding domain
MWILGTVCGLVLLFSYHTSLGNRSGGGTETAQYSDQTASEGTSAGASGAAVPDPSGSASTGSSAGASSATATYKGKAVSTRHGTVQVQVKISGGKIVDVTTLQVPNGNHEDVQINQYAVPILRQAALAAQSADIDSVSGATVTSVGYRQSLQSALDAANFKA